MKCVVWYFRYKCVVSYLCNVGLGSEDVCGSVLEESPLRSSCCGGAALFAAGTVVFGICSLSCAVICDFIYCTSDSIHRYVSGLRLWDASGEDSSRT